MMKIYIYDIEVLSDNWIAIFRRPEPGSDHIVIHNDIYHLRSFLDQDDIVIGGFNNKHYDDWIILTMYLGGSNVEVKRHNDYIISGGNGWDFPFIKGQRKPFRSFDLRDDIADKGISLKAIEGNLKLPIVESSIPFDINRPLKPKELEEVILYCKHDVDATIALYKARNDYISSKRIVGKMYGVDESVALGLTNAKLSARVLGAKLVERDDERDYKVPDNLDPRLIPEQVMKFFLQIRDLSIPDEVLFGTGKQGSKGMTLGVWIETSSGRCPVTYAWGGVHGAKPAYHFKSTEKRLLINWDVASLYPNSMINFGYTSRSMADPDAYKKLVATRLEAKKAGDDEKATALKLVVNTVYGAMLNRYNDLADRLAGRSVCITNQLAMTQLITMLSRYCRSIDFVNINTDGVMFEIDAEEEAKSSAIVDQWCVITGFEMERDDFSEIWQKDVNNYIGIKTNGKMKTKGGFVSLYKGGNFKTNSLQIIHKAVVDAIVKGIDPEVTIKNETDIFSFQSIVKTGGSYEGSYHYIDGERIQIQKVNRIYAVKDPRYGAIVKGKLITEKRKKNKATGKMEIIPVDPPIWSESTIPECPGHAYVDNENQLTVKDLDLDYYIRMARERVLKYTELDRKVEAKLKKITEVITMATTEANTPQSTNIYRKLALARQRFLEAPVKKSGVNRFAEFKYFELADIVPVATKIFLDLGLLYIVTFDKDQAVGTLIDVDDDEHFIAFYSPWVDLATVDKSGETKLPAGMNTIQALGGAQTYQRRYLWMLCLDIVEADAFDAVSGKPESYVQAAPVADSKAATPKASNVTDMKSSAPQATAQAAKKRAPVAAETRDDIKRDLTSVDGEADATQKKSIVNGLKKLRAKSAENEPYIGKITKEIRSDGLSKKRADEILAEIGEKLKD